MIVRGAMEDGCLKLSDTAKNTIYLVKANIPIFRIVGMLVPVIRPKEAKESIE
jgi:hypothetical protein